VAFNISEFKSFLNASGGPARSAHFLVRITPPPGVRTNSGISSQDLTFFCDSAQLPGVSLGTDNVKHAGYGVQEARPYSVLFEPFSCTFIGDSQGQILQYFHNWMKFINNWPIENTGSVVTSKIRDTFSYPSDYYTRVQVITYDNTGEEVKQYTLENAYPLTVGSVDVNWNNIDALVSIPMTFQYHSWNVNSFALDEIGQGPGSSVSAGLAPFVPYVFNLTQLEQIVSSGDVSSSVLYNLLLR
jgi:hypothetical protein